MTKQFKGLSYGNIGLMMAVFTLLAFPIIFGPLAVIFGYLAYKDGDTQKGIMAIILGIVLAIVSYFIGMFFISLLYL